MTCAALLSVAAAAHAQTPNGKWEDAPASWWLVSPPMLPSKNLIDTPHCRVDTLADCMRNYEVARGKNATAWVNFYGTMIQARTAHALKNAREAKDAEAIAELVALQPKYPPEPSRVLARLREDMEKNYSQKVESWDGSNVMDLIKSWGPPTSEYKAPDGSLMLTYKNDRLINGDQFTCNTTFTLKANKVVDWSWRGNGCFSRD